MALNTMFGAGRARAGGHSPRALALLGLSLASASCVPAIGADPVELGFVAVARPGAPIPGTSFSPNRPMLPASVGPAARPAAFTAGTSLDRLRSLDCLAQAIYYEARSESEAGQRAVAQVVLNRVRHPAWPNSVCGVVYQGPLRAGGGCQFTFTCDGSLARRPGGLGWARARALAAEALAGGVYAPVGLSTHYHTHAVAPSWAPRLALTTVIGAHIFYRLPGSGGMPGAFTAAYAGHEPLPVPSMTLVRAQQPLATDFAALLPVTPAAVRATVTVPSDIPQDARWTAENLPESTIREEYRQSGQWRADAPTALTGAR